MICNYGFRGVLVYRFYRSLVIDGIAHAPHIPLKYSCASNYVFFPPSLSLSPSLNAHLSLLLSFPTYYSRPPLFPHFLNLSTSSSLSYHYLPKELATPAASASSATVLWLPGCTRSPRTPTSPLQPPPPICQSDKLRSFPPPSKLQVLSLFGLFITVVIIVVSPPPPPPPLKALV